MAQDSEGPPKESKPALPNRVKRGIVRRVAHWLFEFDLMALPVKLRERRERFDRLKERHDTLAKNHDALVKAHDILHGDYTGLKEAFQTFRREQVEANRAFREHGRSTERIAKELAGQKEAFQTFRREQVAENKGFREHARTTERLETEYTHFKEAFQAFRQQQSHKHREFSEGLAGFRVHLDNLRKREDALDNQLALLKAVLESAAANPHVFWLFADRVERMDANLPIYNEARRRFHRARYEFAARHVAQARVADIACGTGYGTAILKHDGNAMHVTGIDIDPGAVAYAEAVYGSADIAFVAADAQATGLAAETFDVIASFETIEHVPDDAAIVAEFARLLKPDGRLIISTPNQWPLDIAPYHVREYDRAAFETVLSPHFEINALYNQNSGTTSQFNRGQPEGIVETTTDNEELAECYIALCTRR
ncbi:MAG: methyltransferase domain-containing protein [Candidatus Hydrogenedentota bacterium]